MRIGTESRKAETIVTGDISLGPSEFSFITLCRVLPNIFLFFSYTLHPGNDIARFSIVLFMFIQLFL